MPMRKISDIDKTIKSYEAGYKVGFSDAKSVILDNLISEVGNYELNCKITNCLSDECSGCCSTIFNKIYNIIDNSSLKEGDSE